MLHTGNAEIYNFKYFVFQKKKDERRELGK